jgi:pentatricopeptide repeat protein
MMMMMMMKRNPRNIFHMVSRRERTRVIPHRNDNERCCMFPSLIIIGSCHESQRNHYSRYMFNELNGQCTHLSLTQSSNGHQLGNNNNCTMMNNPMQSLLDKMIETTLQMPCETEEQADFVNTNLKAIIACLIKWKNDHNTNGQQGIEQDENDINNREQVYHNALNTIVYRLFQNSIKHRNASTARNLIVLILCRMRDSGNRLGIDITMSKNQFLRSLHLTNESYKKSINYFENNMRPLNHFNEQTFSLIIQILSSKVAELQIDVIPWEEYTSVENDTTFVQFSQRRQHMFNREFLNRLQQQSGELLQMNDMMYQQSPEAINASVDAIGNSNGNGNSNSNSNSNSNNNNNNNNTNDGVKVQQQQQMIQNNLNILYGNAALRSMLHSESLAMRFQEKMEHYLDMFVQLIPLDSTSVEFRQELISHVIFGHVNIELRKLNQAEYEHYLKSITAKQQFVNQIREQMLNYCQKLNIEPFEFLDRILLKVMLYYKLSLRLDAVKYIQALRESKKGLLQLETYNIVLELLAKQGNVQKVIALIHDMEQVAHLKPDAYSFQLIILSIIKKADETAIEELLQMMKERGLEPTELTHNVILYHYSLQNQVEKAKVYFQKIPKKLEEMSTSMHSTMLYLYLRNDCIEEAERLSDQILNSGRELSVNICNEFIKYYQKVANEEAKTRWTYRLTYLLYSKRSEIGQTVNTNTHKKKSDETTARKYQKYAAKLDRKIRKK